VEEALAMFVLNGKLAKNCDVGKREFWVAAELFFTNKKTEYALIAYPVSFGDSAPLNAQIQRQVGFP
jgi:hypothetical protein